MKPFEKNMHPSLNFASVDGRRGGVHVDKFLRRMRCRREAVTCLAVFFTRAGAMVIAAIAGAISPALADCTTSTSGTVVNLSCASPTITTNTTNSNGSNASTSDRTQSFADDITANIANGVTVGGYGLNIVPTGGDHTVTITNNSTVAASGFVLYPIPTLGVVGDGGQITYLGNGTISNPQNSSIVYSGLVFSNTGAGSIQVGTTASPITATISGGQFGSAASAVSITTANGDQNLFFNGGSITSTSSALQLNATGTGNINATLAGNTTIEGTYGVQATTTSGSIAISSNATIGNHSSPISFIGISAIAGGNASVTLTGGSIYSNQGGIDVSAQSNSATVVTAPGTVITTLGYAELGDGININGGNILQSVTVGGAINAIGNGIDASGVAPLTVSVSGTINATQAGIVFSNPSATITNSGNVTGSVAILAENVPGSTSVTNGGVLTGTGGNAIQFDGSANSLTLLPGSMIVGNVVGTGSDTLLLGGTGTATFNVGDIGTNQQYQGFSTFVKNGTSTWTLTGSGTQDWTVSAGRLVGDTNSLQGTALIDNAALSFNQSFNGAYSGAISGTGGVAINGTGTLTLSGSNSYTGTTSIESGGLSISSPENIGTGPIFFASNTELAVTGSGTFSNPVTLASNPAIDVSNGATVVWSGQIAGTGGLALTGGGVFEPTNALNSYAGGTSVVNNSTLLVDSDGELGATSASLALGDSTTGGTLKLNGAFDVSSARSITLNAGGGTIDTNGYSTTISQIIGGSGGLTKTGTGILTLSATNTYSGATTVTGGTLAVDGAIVNGVTVNSGGTLTGTGAIGSTVIASGGTLGPGGVGGIGTLTVNGNLNLAAGSTYQVAITSAGSEAANVTGTADVAGTIIVSPQGGGYSFNQTINVLTATDGVSGTFSALDISGSFGADIVPILGYGSNDVFLRLLPESVRQLLPEHAPRAIESVAAAIDVADASDDYNAFAPLYSLSTSALTRALTQLSGQVGIDAAESAFELSGPFMDMLADKGVTDSELDSRSALQSPVLTRLAYNGPQNDLPYATKPTNTLNIWSTAYGGWSSLPGDETSLGTQNTRNTNGGLALGIEYVIDSRSLLGIAMGIGRTSWTSGNDLGNGRGNSAQLGVYGSGGIRAVYFSGAASLALYNMTTNTNVALAGVNLYRGAFDAKDEAVRIEAGRRFVLGTGLWLGPYIAFDGQFYQAPAYTEKTLVGSPLYALSYASQSQSDISHDLGLQLDKQWQSYDGMAAAIFMRTGWYHQYSGSLMGQASFDASPSTDFTAYGTRGPNNAARFSVSGIGRLTNALSLSIELQTLFSGTAQSYDGNATFAYHW